MFYFIYIFNPPPAEKSCRSLNRGLFYTQYNVIPREKTSANPDMFDCSDYWKVPVPAPIT